VQTLTGFVYLFLLPKFIEECNGLPLDGAADSTRCTELCARTARVSQQCLTRTLRKWLDRNNGHLINLNTMEICLESDAWCYVVTVVRSPKQFLN